MLTIKKRSAHILLVSLTLYSAFLFTGCTPPGPRALLDGERLLREGKTEEAVEKLETAARLLPKDARARNFLGLAYHRTGRVKNAIQAYQAALSLNRDLAVARYNLGCLYLEQNDAAAAANELATYTTLQPESFDGWRKRGEAALKLHQLDVAEKCYAQAYRIAPTNAEVLNGIGIIYYNRKRYREAAAFFTDAAKQQPPCKEALLNLAIVSQEHLGNKPLALEKYQAFLASHPRNANVGAVKEVMTRLDVELYPQHALAAVTNPPPVQANVKTNPPPATNAVAVVKTNIPPSPVMVTATNARPTNATAVVATEKPKPPAAVNVTPLPPLKPEPVTNAVAAHPVEPPRVESPKPKPTPPVRPAPVVVARVEPPPATPPPPTVAAKPVVAETETPADSPRKEEPEEKRGFFQRINPLNLFRAPPKKTTPLPGTTAKVAVKPAPPQPTIIASATPSPDVVTAPPPAPVVAAPPKRPPPPSYSYRHPGKPELGVRAEAEPYFQRGLKAQLAKDPNAAAQAYRAAIQADPAFYEAYFNLGLVAFDLNDLDSSLQAYETALAINPLSTNARYNFALALQKGRYYRDAANELEKLLAIAPDETRSHLALANLYAQELYDRSAAREHYLKVLQLEPHHPQADEIRYWLVANPQ